MIKKLHFKTLLLLCAMIMGIGSAWGADETFTFSEMGYANGDDVTTVEGDNVTLTFAQGEGNNAPKYYTTGSGVRMYTSNTLEIALNDQEGDTRITAVNFTFSGTYTGSLQNWTGSETSVSFQNTASTQARIQEIKVTLTTGGDPIPTTYTVTYDANGGTGTINDASSPYNAGATVTVLDNTFTRNGYTFTKWNTAADGKGTSYNGGDTFTINANTTLYAQWEEQSTGNIQWVLTNLADLTSSDVFVIVGNNGSNFAMSNDNGTSSAPATVDVEINGSVITSAVAANIQWTVSGDATNGYTFYPNGSTTTWLYCNTTAESSSNNNMRVGTGDRKVFELNSNNYLMTKDDKTTRYLSIYNDTDWRGYVNTNLCPTISFYKKVIDGVVPPSISAENVSLDYNETTGSISYTINNSVEGGVITASTEAEWLTFGTASDVSIPFTCSANTETAERTATVTLTYAYGDNETVTKDVTVTQAAYVDPNAPGTENNPYTVAQARAAIDAGTGTQGVYATGIVSEIPTAYNSQYSNITFNFVDNSGDQTFLQAYRCQGDEAADVQVGDIVVVCGNLTKYNTTYEFAQGCTLVSLTHSQSVAPVITADNVNIAYNAISGSIEYTIDNEPTPAGTLNASVAEGSWLNLGTVGTTVPFTCDANTSATARTATVTLTYTYGNNQTVTKDVTVTQAGAPTIASLPFEFDGGKADVEGADGLTQEGLGSDYNSSPKLKFDSTGDWLLLQFDGCPGTLTFDIKGNSFSGGTFKVQTSEDGVTYTDLETYTELGTTQNEEFNNLGENVRYIKWIYTEKDNGNVALGKIVLYEPNSTPSIAVDPATVNVDAGEHEDDLNFTYENLTVTSPSDFEIQYYDAEGVETTSSDWIYARVAEQNPDVGEGYVVHYDIDANEGEARTVYFKVFAYDSEANPVYSNLVTITQAKYVETTTYTLATSITSGKHYVIASGTEGDVMVMGAQNNNNRAAVGGTVSGTTLSVASNATEFVIYGPDANGNYAIYDNANGYLYAASSSSNHLKSQTTNNANGMWSIRIDESGVASVVAQGDNTRNVMQYNSGSTIFSCYGSASQSPVYLYEKDDEAAPTETVHITDAKYATYFSENALDFSNTGLTAYIAKMNGSIVSFEPVTKVPAYSGVLLKADAAGDVPVGVATTVDDVTDNAFIGVIEATLVSEPGIFVLLNGDEGVGFYKTTKAFTVGAHTAYLSALAGGSRSFIGLNETTGISDMNRETITNNRYFDLQGRRVLAPTKGLYIVNGKKVVVK